ncbi:MAG: GIY-YIG nuclease family protein [Planctomycetes bacterium]|nr:GIY-YIG nuclease family protein [Planctomycetota bacterium]
MWYLYILECSDKTYYTGITKDIEHRLAMHNSGKGARYTRTRTPAILVYRERCGGQAKAMKREIQVKGFPKAKKKELIDKQAKRNKRIAVKAGRNQ